MSDKTGFVTPSDLDQSAPTPLYRQLAELIRSRIVSGGLDEGDRLPTEQSLSRDLGIGISTVRNAYALLVDEGIVSRRAGRGSFVSRPRLDRDLHGLYNFSDEVRLMGMEPSSVVLDFGEFVPSAEVARDLGITPSESVYQVSRVRCADGRPLLLERSLIPSRLCPGLTRTDVEGSLYEAIGRLSSAPPAAAHEVHEATVLSTDEAGVLDREPGSPAFRITRLTTNVHGETCERCEAIAPGDGTRYVVDLRIDGSTSTKKLLLPGTSE